MCGILGQVKFTSSYTNILDISSIRFRGQDHFSCINTDSLTSIPTLLSVPASSQKLKTLFVAHALHAIKPHLAQPLIDEHGNILVYNGEIYNYITLLEHNHLSFSNDSQLLLHLLNTLGIQQTLNIIEGDYAFAYYCVSQNTWYLTRDLLGIKPLFYHVHPHYGFSFSSYHKSLKEYTELSPRQLLCINMQTQTSSFIEKKFFSYNTPHSVSIEQATQEVTHYLCDAIRKRTHDYQPVALLFSGGIDSGLIAYILKQHLHVPFKCFVTGFDGAKDTSASLAIAHQYDFDIEYCTPSSHEVIEAITLIGNLLNTTNYVLISTAVTYYFALQAAGKYSKVCLSGLGSEEIYAGYKRFEFATSLQAESIAGLQSLYTRDMYRDDTIAMLHHTELRFPFLDHHLITHALKLPDKYKLHDGKKKIILEHVAKYLGYKKEFAERKKLAAQYGSGIDKFINKLAKQSGMNKSEFVESLISF